MRILPRMCSRFGEILAGPKVSPGSRARLAISNVLDVKKTLSTKEWMKLKDTFSSSGFAYQAIQVLLVRDSGLTEIKKCIRALEESNAMNPILKSQILVVFDQYSSDCTETDHQFILNTCNEVLSLFPTLTEEIGNGLLKGLKSTPFWKDKADLILTKMGNNITHRTLDCYASLAFANKNFELGWETMRKSILFGHNFTPLVYKSIVDSHILHPEEDNIFKLLNFVEEHSTMITSHAAEQISDILDKSDEWVSRFAHVAYSGHCSCCKRKLEKVPLSSEEHESLLYDLDKTFGLDCKFTSYELEEVGEFKTFLKNCPPYSVVIDGPNLFYREASVKAVRDTCSKLVQQGHKILLICRAHMKNNKEFMRVFRDHLVFFVNNRSMDDSFIIYSALHAGQDTLVISNDYYGTYYTQVKREHRMLFRRWQLSNHVVGVGYRAANLVIPTYTPVCQMSENGSTIHVPLVTDDNFDAFAPYAWLCLQRVSKEQKKKASTLWPHQNFLHKSEGAVNAFKMHVSQVRNQNKRNGKPETKHTRRQYEFKQW